MHDQCLCLLYLKGGGTRIFSHWVFMWQVKPLLLRRCQWYAVISYNTIIMWREEVRTVNKTLQWQLKTAGMHSKGKKRNPTQWKFWEGNNINNCILKEANQDLALPSFLTVKKAAFTEWKGKERGKKMQLKSLILTLNTGKNLSPFAGTHSLSEVHVKKKQNQDLTLSSIFSM